ncbi:response regulator [Aneurinibacillus terranovensis]|uniref:response regulator n=1 Tax=Aneurinibacillus terranovensis TaxID=278991 RepID=UPI00048354C2
MFYGSQAAELGAFKHHPMGDVFIFQGEGNIAKIMIAEDHAGIRFLYRTLLTSKGHQIIAETTNLERMM